MAAQVFADAELERLRGFPEIGRDELFRFFTILAWTAEWYVREDTLRAAGRQVDDEVLAHISPAHSENINFFGAIEVDIDAELAQLGPTGYRPLRVRDTLF
ncbi:MAG: hypothetical protein ACT4NY_02000 [Pseudonocardiales bacterium]